MRETGTLVCWATTTACHDVALGKSQTGKSDDFSILGHDHDLLIKYLHHTVHDTIIRFYQIKRFPFERNRDFHKNGTMISKVRTGDVFHPGLLRSDVLLAITHKQRF